MIVAGPTSCYPVYLLEALLASPRPVLVHATSPAATTWAGRRPRGPGGWLVQGLLASDRRAYRLWWGAGLELLLCPLLSSGLRVPDRLTGTGPGDVSLLLARSRGRCPSGGVQSLTRLTCLQGGARVGR